jgi:hypothetical protein
MKEAEMSKTSRTHGQDIYKIAAGKHHGRRPRIRRKDNVSILKKQKIGKKSTGFKVRSSDGLLSRR